MDTKKLKYSADARARFVKSRVRESTNIIKRHRKKASIITVAVIFPLLLLGFLYYGNQTVKDWAASLRVAPQAEEGAGEKQSEGEKVHLSGLRLTEREKFLEQYKTKPAFLPQTTEIRTSLTGFIRANSRPELLPARNWGVKFKDINAESAIAMDVPSKRILYGKNISEPRPIASISKLVTAMVVVDNLDLNEQITVQEEAIETRGNSAGLIEGEKLTTKQLLQALLLESSNDAGVALQTYYDENNNSGGGPSFVELMNRKAGELNLTNTSFEDPTGLNEKNISTAHEVAQIMYAAWENEVLREILNQPNATVEVSNKDITHYWINLNALLDAYDGVVAGKTGFTEEAGPSMTVLSETPNKQKYLVVATLNAKDRVEATRNLLNWVKKAYIWKE